MEFYRLTIIEQLDLVFLLFNNLTVLLSYSTGLRPSAARLLKLRPTSDLQCVPLASEHLVVI